MTEDERASQLSAMFDGELPPAECELLARRLSRDEALRRQWGSYALIGAAVRGEPIVARGTPSRSAASLIPIESANLTASTSNSGGYVRRTLFSPIPVFRSSQVTTTQVYVETGHVQRSSMRSG